MLRKGKVGLYGANMVDEHKVWMLWLFSHGAVAKAFSLELKQLHTTSCLIVPTLNPVETSI